MALAIVNLDANSDVSGSSPTTASLTPDSGSILYLVFGYSLDAPNGTHPSDSFSISGVMATWTQVAWAEPDQLNRRALVIYRGTGTITPGTISIGITPFGGAGTLESVHWSVVQVTGHDTTTPNDAAVTNFSNSSQAGGSTGDVGTLDAGDMVLAAFTHETNEAVTLESEGTTWIELSHTGQANGLRTLTVGYSASDETPTASWSTNSSWTAIGVILNVGEDVGGGGSASPPPVPMRFLRGPRNPLARRPS